MMKRRMLWAFLPLFLSLSSTASYLNIPQSLDQAVDLWQSTERGIRDDTVPREEARRRFVTALTVIRRLYPAQPASPRWRFPLDGYGNHDFGASSYKPRGFDYLAAARGGAVHPAVDIFVKDKRQRARDDHNGKPISVHAAFGGLVVSVQPVWKDGDDYRGGVYTYVMDPPTGRLAYYAHLDHLDVDSGQVVRRGQVLGTLGRTGRNAIKKRSGTHLHLMWMELDPDGQFRCLNPCGPLRAAQHQAVFD